MTIKCCFIASSDFTDPCYSVSVENSIQPFFWFSCLPNGLTFAAIIFTKIMKLALSSLKKSCYYGMNYFDETFIFWNTFEECIDTMLATVNLLLKLGFLLTSKNHNSRQYKKFNIFSLLRIQLKWKYLWQRQNKMELKNLIAKISN